MFDQVFFFIQINCQEIWSLLFEDVYPLITGTTIYILVSVVVLIKIICYSIHIGRIFSVWLIIGVVFLFMVSH